MDLNEGGSRERHPDAAPADAGGECTANGGRSREETLVYVGQMIKDLRELAEQAGSERLATLLALAQYEVRGLLGRSGGSDSVSCP